MHGHVEGVTPAGVAYGANDPRLLDWVHATATFGFTEAYHQYAERLSAAQKDAAFAEGQASSKLYGACGAPRSWAEWESLCGRTAPALDESDILADFMRVMGEAPILPAPMRWLQRLLVRRRRANNAGAGSLTATTAQPWPALRRSSAGTHADAPGRTTASERYAARPSRPPRRRTTIVKHTISPAPR